MLDKVDCVNIAKELFERKRKEDIAFKRLGKLGLITIGLYVIVLPLALTFVPSWVLAFFVVTSIALGYFFIKNASAAAKYGLTTKENILFRLSRTFSLIQDYKDKSASDGAERERAINNLKELQRSLTGELGFTRRTGFKFNKDYNIFIRLLKKSIKKHFLSKIEIEKELGKIMSELEEIATYVNNEKFEEGINYFEKTLDIRIEKITTLSQMWEKFNAFKLRDNVTALIFSILIAIVFVYISKTYNLINYTNVISVAGVVIGMIGLERIIEPYMPVLFESINIKILNQRKNK